MAIDINAASCELEFVVGDGSLVLWVRNFGVQGRAEFSEIGALRQSAPADDPDNADNDEAKADAVRIEAECNARLRALNAAHLSRYQLTRDGEAVDLGPDWRDLIADAGYLDEWNGLTIARECSFRLLVTPRGGAGRSGGSGGGSGVDPEGGRPEQ